MAFAGINYGAVGAAAVAGWLASAGWYTALGKPWMAAVGITPQQMEEYRTRPRAFLPFVYAFVADLIMAWVLAGVIGHVGTHSLRCGAISGALCWLGFVITTLFVNYSFGRRDPRLIAIDGGHWLLVLVIMGAVIGGMGV